LTKDDGTQQMGDCQAVLSGEALAKTEALAKAGFSSALKGQEE
jgi:hypothetical protein